MRAPIILATAVLALSAAACTTATKQEAAKDDFQRDLQLASATNMDLAAPEVNSALLTSLETAPGAAPKPAPTLKKDAEGDHAVPSDAPTVEATPEPEPAPVEETQPVAPIVAPAPVPEPINEPVAVAPRPQPVPATPAGGIGAGDYGRGGGVFGGGNGSVIRGGGVDGDRCEIHSRRGGGTIIFRSPVYVPRSLPATATAPVRVRVVSPRGLTIAGR